MRVIHYKSVSILSACQLHPGVSCSRDAPKLLYEMSGGFAGKQQAAVYTISVTQEIPIIRGARAYDREYMAMVLLCICIWILTGIHATERFPYSIMCIESWSKWNLRESNMSDGLQWLKGQKGGNWLYLLWFLNDSFSASFLGLRAWEGRVRFS